MAMKKATVKSKKKKYEIGKVPEILAPNFIMNPVELHQYLPKGAKFSIKRIYWLASPTGEKKSGQHAHTDEDEVFVVIQGSTQIILDDGSGLNKIKFTKNDIAWVPRLVWHGYENFSADCIILALTSTNYDPSRAGYVDDYEEFKKIVSAK